MANHRPETKGFIKEHKDRKGITFLVGAENLSNKEYLYRGPTAQITWDDTWLYIETDPYESSVMINIEALPHLRRALAKIARHRTHGQADK